MEVVVVDGRVIFVISVEFVIVFVEVSNVILVKVFVLFEFI